MGRDHEVQQIWEDLMQILEKGKRVPTFKGRETFIIKDFSDQGIVIRLTSKEKEVQLSRTAIFNTIEKLIDHQDGVRQKMVDPEARLKLGLLLLLPYTERIERTVNGKKKKFLVLNEGRRQELMGVQG